MAEEGMKHTDNKLIHIGKPIPFDINTFLGQLEELAEGLFNNLNSIMVSLCSECHIERVKYIGQKKFL